MSPKLNVNSRSWADCGKSFDRFLMGKAQLSLNLSWEPFAYVAPLNQMQPPEVRRPKGLIALLQEACCVLYSMR